MVNNLINIVSAFYYKPTKQYIYEINWIDNIYSEYILVDGSRLVLETSKFDLFLFNSKYGDVFEKLIDSSGNEYFNKIDNYEGKIFDRGR